MMAFQVNYCLSISSRLQYFTNLVFSTALDVHLLPVPHGAVADEMKVDEASLFCRLGKSCFDCLCTKFSKCR